jgi:hypothetical protein
VAETIDPQEDSFAQRSSTDKARANGFSFSVVVLVVVFVTLVKSSTPGTMRRSTGGEFSAGDLHHEALRAPGMDPS